MAASVDETHALRALLRTHFECHAKGLEQAVDAKEAFNEVARGTMAILYDILHEWNELHNALRCLPREVLAHCFMFLPLPDRMTVARVSHSWRTIALSHPAIWTDMTFSDDFPVRAGVLKAVLSRTGRLSIHLHSQDYQFSDPNGAITSCLARHMHRFRIINWGAMSCLPLNVRAPLLETLIGRGEVQLPPEFLGGMRGSLRTLRLGRVWFPAVCPAVSTVTHLILDSADDEARAATLGGLFRLFPALQYLSISWLQPQYSYSLPQTPAPSSLKRLGLQTRGYGYDLIQHYVAWQTGHLRDVSLNQACIPAHLDRLFDGAEELTIDTGYDDSGFEGCTYDIVALGPAQRRCAIHFEDKFRRRSSVAFDDSVTKSLCRLVTVRALEFPGSMVYALLQVITALPNLSRLTLRVVTGHVWWPPTPRPDWNPLLPLARALDRRATRLQGMVIRVGHDCASPPNTQDARDLLDQLAALANCKLPDVRVEGFPAATVVGLDTGNFEGFCVDFATAQ